MRTFAAGFALSAGRWLCVRRRRQIRDLHRAAGRTHHLELHHAVHHHLIRLGIRTQAGAREHAGGGSSVFREVGAGFRYVWSDPRPRVMVTTLGLGTFVLGFVDILANEGALAHPLSGPKEQLFWRRTVVRSAEPPRSLVPVVESGVKASVGAVFDIRPRKPVADVFESIVEPETTSKFWFTKGSGRLEVGKQVQWDWEMYNISIPVTAKVIEPNKRILIEWPGYSGLTTVEWTFEAQEDGTTFVNITESGFTGDGDELVKQVTSSTEGFTLVLAGLKAWLKHNIKLNLVGDRFPKGIEEL